MIYNEFADETQRRLRVVHAFADDNADEMIERGNFPHMPLEVIEAIAKVQCYITLNRATLEDIGGA